MARAPRATGAARRLRRRTSARSKRGLTLAELLLAVGVIAALLCLLVPAAQRRIAEDHRRRCQLNLNQIAKALVTYLGEHGDNRYLPCPLGFATQPDTYNGAEWLAHLYWAGTCPDPRVFLCPGSRDANRDGKDLGRSGFQVALWYGRAAATFGSQSVSYGGLAHGSITAVDGQPLPIRDDLPPHEPMASDDTQGTLNHGRGRYGGMNVLFADSHVEFKAKLEVDPRTAVGAAAAPGHPRPLLWRLRN